MKARNNTAELVLDVAQELIQKRGYNAISFNDIAKEVGIKKPSIVHHFPSKEALGKAVVIRYRDVFSSALNNMSNDQTKSATDAFDFYCTPYIDFGTTDDKVCLCGALAGEYPALPDEVRAEVTLFFEEHVRWLTMILERGLTSGEFDFTTPAKNLASHILDSLQGALTIKRATGNIEHIHNTIALLKRTFQTTLH